MNIEEAAKAFGKPVSHIEAVALGRKMKGEPTLAVPEQFEIRHEHVTRSIGVLTVVMDRRELWGDNRLLWAIESGTPVC